jgi:hypothetical protein
MKATEFRQEQDFKFDHFSKLTQTGIKPNYENIDKFAESYHQNELKKLRVADVIKNEVAVCIHENIEVILPVRRCLKCQQIKEWTPKQTVL